MKLFMVRGLKSLQNTAGNTLVSVLVISVVLLTGVVITFQYIQLNMNQSIKSSVATKTADEELLALNVLAGKVQLKKPDSSGSTEWVPEFYPSKDELVRDTFKPFFIPTTSNARLPSLVPNLRVGGSKESGTCRDLPVPKDRLNAREPEPQECNLTNFSLDGSRLGSLEKGEDLEGWKATLNERNQKEEQKGFIGYPALSRLNGNASTQYFNSAEASVPESAIQPKAFVIHRLVSNASDPLVMSGIEVSMGKTRAIVSINPPPEPTCELKAEVAPRGQTCFNQTSYVPSTSTTQVPRNSITVLRCSPNPGAQFLPLYPAVGSCPAGQYSVGAITFYRSTNPIWHVNLGPRPNFPQRGLIYSTHLGGEQLGQDELNGAGTYQISFDRLLQELGQPTTESVTTTVNNPVTSRVCRTIETPECNGDCVELGGNRGVTAKLYTDSVASVAKVSGDDFFSSTSFSMERYRLTQLGKFDFSAPPIGTTVVLPPANLYSVQPPRLWVNPDGSVDDAHGTWSVAAKVSGLSRSSESRTCGTKFKVFPPPPPRCVASVTRDNILKDQFTTVTLNCTGSSRITNANIIGGNNFSLTSFSSGRKIASTTYQRKSLVGPERIDILVKGLGGSIIVSTGLDAVCPYNDPNKTYTASGRVFRRTFWQITDHIHTHENNATWQKADGSFWVCGNNNFCMGSFVTNVEPMSVHYVKFGPNYDSACGLLEYHVRTNGCFTSDTQIRMADGSDKKISTLKENDYVLNPLFKQPVRISKLVKGPEKKALYLVRVGKDKLTVTEDHPFLTQRGWLMAKELQADDFVMGEVIFRKVTSVRQLPFKNPVDVYNFELDTDVPEGHIVLANRIPTGDLTTQNALKNKKTSQTP